MKRVALPSPDGASFRCNLVVQRPAPTWWDQCDEVAVAAYRPDAVAAAGGGFLELRCATHIPI